jgi:Nickel/cobalt transporter regulator
MLRKFVLVATVALVLPTIAAAQDHHDDHGKKAGPTHPGPGGPPPPPPAFKPALKPVLKPAPPHGPIGGPPGPPPAAFVHPSGPQFSFHGHAFNRIHIHPFIYPNGWAYRQWAVGAILPPLFLAPDYYYPEWAALGLEPPPPGDQWVRYGPDLLLVNVATGQVVDVAYGVFYDD